MSEQVVKKHSMCAVHLLSAKENIVRGMADRLVYEKLRAVLTKTAGYFFKDRIEDVAYDLRVTVPYLRGKIRILRQQGLMDYNKQRKVYHIKASHLAYKALYANKHVGRSKVRIEKESLLASTTRDFKAMISVAWEKRICLANTAERMLWEKRAKKADKGKPVFLKKKKVDERDGTVFVEKTEIPVETIRYELERLGYGTKAVLGSSERSAIIERSVSLSEGDNQNSSCIDKSSGFVSNSMVGAHIGRSTSCAWKYRKHAMRILPNNYVCKTEIVVLAKWEYEMYKEVGFLNSVWNNDLTPHAMRGVFGQVSSTHLRNRAKGGTILTFATPELKGGYDPYSDDSYFVITLVSKVSITDGFFIRKSVGRKRLARY